MHVPAALFSGVLLLGLLAGSASADGPRPYLSTEYIPFLSDEDLPERPAPIEIGARFFAPGKLHRGLQLPTGAVWSPALWIFGTYRTGINFLDDGSGEALLEMPHRLDLFLNLQLTGTERLVLHLSPLHGNGRFTTFTFSPQGEDDFRDETNLEIEDLYFAGDFGEIFPNLDPEDRKDLDVGFSIGRQQIQFQDGIMFNDSIDSLGLVRNNIFLPGAVQTRATLLLGWGDVHRDDNKRDDNAVVVGFFTETDTRRSTIELDVAWVGSQLDQNSAGDGLYWGLGATQRIGFWNTTFRLNGSRALDEESAAVSDGVLLFGQISTQPPGTHDVVYVNAFWGIDRYSSAARSPTAGGPLGQTGLLFAAVGLGRFRPALGNRADESAGAAVGYQRFWHDDRTQLVLELGGRADTGGGPGAVALGARFQRKLGRRYLVQLDAT